MSGSRGLATLMIFDLFYHQSMQPPDRIELARYPDFPPTATDDDYEIEVFSSSV